MDILKTAGTSVSLVLTAVGEVVKHVAGLGWFAHIIER